MNYQLLKISSITPSLTNAARAARYKADSLAELAANIKTTGVRQPILVRPLPASRLADTFDSANASGATRRPEYELIAGQRRWQASQMAELAIIPAMIATDMADDVDALRFQLVENLQREDLDPMDEAEGYQRLIDATGASKEDIGAQINKSRRYVYDRLTLLRLCTEARTALEQGTITVSHAKLLALIPHDHLQSKALSFACEKTDSGESISVRSFQRWIRQNVTLDLKHATFKITDASLVPAAGDCKQCPKRTGFAPDLFAHIDGADICTDPVCYHSKADAHRAKLLAAAQAKGYTLLAGKEAKAVLKGQFGDNLQGYSNLDQIRRDIDTDLDQPRSLRKLLGKAAIAQLSPVVIEHPDTQKLIEAVPTDAAEAKLLELGLIKPAQTTKAAKADIDKIKAKRAADTYLKDLVMEAVLTQASAHTCTTADLLHPAILAYLIGRLLRDNFYSIDYKELSKFFSIPAGQYVDDWLKNVTDIDIAADRVVKLVAYAEMKENSSCTEAMARRAHLVTLMGIDFEKIEKQVKATIKAGAQAENKVKKTPAPNAPLAHPNTETGAAKQKSFADRAVPRLKTKFSAQEAQLGIADAMQASDNAAALAAADNLYTSTDDAQTSAAHTFAIGQSVTVTADSHTLRIVAHKYIGKTGIITGKIGDAGWDVNFKGRSGGISSFDSSEISPA